MSSDEQLPILNQSIRKTTFETKIAPLLQYIGGIGAIVMSLAYIIVVMVLIVGFKTQNLTQTIIFAIVNAIIGILIMQLLKVQGVSFARHLPDNKEALDAYNNTKTKDKKLQSIDSYWINSVIKDVLLKGVSTAVTSVGLIYIVIQGSNDYNLLLLALVNLLMFGCFGLLSLNAAYEFFNTRHIPYIIDQVKQSQPEEVITCSQIKMELNGEI